MPEIADRADRPLDLVLFGATGFTGGLTAEYLASHAPPGTRWALAGRSRARLEAVRERLGVPGLTVLHADAHDERSLREVAGQSCVVASTVGPYLEHGEPLVAACAEAGTDYADLTGEPEFVDRMYLGYHQRAVESGARLVHACGFDSIPHDLGVQFTVEQLPEGAPVRVRGMVRTNARFSGGTLASALGAFARVPQMRRAHADRRAVEPRPTGRRVRTVARRPHRDPVTGWWLVPLPTIDPMIVGRSAAALARYGPDFEYAHYAAVKRLPTVVAGIGAAGGLAVAAQVPPVRRLLADRLPAGSGPDQERRDASYFSVRFVGEAGGQQVVTEVSGGDPGYTETSRMLAESALCLAFDDLPATAGQVTTAVAMGPSLRVRLGRAGLEFSVLSR
ncbi:MAG TPA: saccharopine dehydrogenase NADP-binding domain-containing protein [Nocardioidaceae bacterium]|nr:saccharopine dehydrogenase NADP-binding domain-containing protein [Nocardioidaceae bacterium]